MTATTPQAQPVCRVICLGGRGKNESKYLRGRLPVEVALFLSDDHDLGTNARLEGPLLWRVNETTYPDSRQAQSEQFQRRLEGKQTSPSELGFLDERLAELLEGLDVVFLVVGLGGSSGGKLAAQLAQAAHDRGIKAFCFASLPFAFEGARIATAKKAQAELLPLLTGMVTFDNNKLSEELGVKTSLNVAFETQSAWQLQAILDTYENLMRPEGEGFEWPLPVTAVELGDGRPLAQGSKGTRAKAEIHSPQVEAKIQNEPKEVVAVVEEVSPEVEARRKAKLSARNNLGFRETLYRSAKANPQLARDLGGSVGARCLSFCLTMPKKNSRRFEPGAVHIKPGTHVSRLPPTRPAKSGERHGKPIEYPLQRSWLMNRLKPKPTIVGIGQWGRENIERLLHLLPKQYTYYSLELEDKEGAEYGRDELVCYQHTIDASEPILIGNEAQAYTKILQRQAPLILIAEIDNIMEANETLALAEAARLKGMAVNCFITRSEDVDGQASSLAIQAIKELSNTAESIKEFSTNHFDVVIKVEDDLKQLFKYKTSRIANGIESILGRLALGRVVQLALLSLVVIGIYYLNSDWINEIVKTKLGGV